MPNSGEESQPSAPTIPTGAMVLVFSQGSWISGINISRTQADNLLTITHYSPAAGLGCRSVTNWCRSLGGCCFMGRQVSGGRGWFRWSAVKKEEPTISRPPAAGFRHRSSQEDEQTTGMSHRKPHLHSPCRMGG